MSANFLDLLSEQLLDDDFRIGFGAENVKIPLALALLDARESRGLSQSQLAEICGVSQAYISKLESGEANPTIGKLGSIFAAMWMEPTIGFGPLLPERSSTAPADTEISRATAHAPSQPPSALADTAIAGEQSPRAVSVDD